MTRRLVIAVIAAATTFGIHSLGAIGDDGARVVKISAKRFEYTPREITLKKGKPVILQFTSTDCVHGFSLPAMNLQAKIEPGKVCELKLTPLKAGTLDFYCDIFCGARHDDMTGKIIVTE